MPQSMLAKCFSNALAPSAPSRSRYRLSRGHQYRDREGADGARVRGQTEYQTHDAFFSSPKSVRATGGLFCAAGGRLLRVDDIQQMLVGRLLVPTLESAEGSRSACDVSASRLPERAGNSC